MKVERIKRMQSHGVFRTFRWPSELPDFSRFNLIYGWNGSGKTTLSRLFYHLQMATNIDDGEVKFQIDGDNIDLHNNGDSLPLGIRVFNKDSVQKSLFEVECGEFPPVFYLGEDSAEKQRAIEKLKSSRDSEAEKLQTHIAEHSRLCKEIDRHCIDKAAEIKALLTKPGRGSYNNYNKSDYKNRCIQILSSQSETFCLLPDTYDSHLRIKDSKTLDEIDPVTTPLPNYFDLQEKVSSLLEKSIISNVIANLAENPKLSKWVQDGIHFHQGEDEIHCEFCTNIVTADRLKQLNEHFNDELTAFQSQIDNEIESLEHWKEKLGEMVFPSEKLLYTELRERYKSAITTWNTTRQMVLMYLDTLIRALKDKKNHLFSALNLSEAVELFGDSEEKKSTVQKVVNLVAEIAQGVSVSFGISALEQLNKVIDDHNEMSSKLAEKRERSSLILEIHTVSLYVFDYIEKEQAVDATNEEIHSVNERIRELELQLAELESEVSEIVRPAVELNEEMASYLGREELNFAVKDNGYVITRNGYPAKNLSEGEQTAIAFIYFLKTLEDKNFDITESIVVIDDPISSLDFNTMYSAYSFMKSRTRNVGQLFVLTHCFTFFRHVRRWFKTEPKLPAIPSHEGSAGYRVPSRFYMLETTTNSGVRSSNICQLDPLLEKFESEYQYLFKKVYEFVEQQTPTSLESYYGLPNIARRLLESFLTFKFPHIEARRLEKKLEELNYDEAKKTRILRFLNVHSHYDQVGAPEHDLSLLSETPSVLNDLMQLIKKIDQEHYRGMVSSMVEVA